MKKLLTLLLIIPFVFACSSDDDDDNYTPTEYEKLLMGDLSGYWYTKSDDGKQIHRRYFYPNKRIVESASQFPDSSFKDEFIMSSETSYSITDDHIYKVPYTPGMPIEIIGNSTIILDGRVFTR